MCKVAGVTKVTDQNRDDVWDYMVALGDEMSKGNNDGIGYAAFDSKGNIFGEKWLINKTSFVPLERCFPKMPKDKHKNFYDSFGELRSNEASAIILHTRMATCEKGIKNAHPFVDSLDAPKVAIIHNGVIHNHRSLEKKFSTCDSEVIAHLYKDMRVNAHFNNIKSVAKRLNGWYTVLTLSKDSDHRLYMDAFSDSTRLASCYIPQLDTRVYSTSQMDLVAAASVFNYDCQDFKQIVPNTAFRVDVLTGEITHNTTIESNRTSYDYFGGVYHENGNLSDDEFKRRFFNGYGYSGD